MPQLRFCCRYLALLALLMLVFAPQLARARASAPWSELGNTSFTHHREPSLGVGTALAQDRQGFVWLGTQIGLMRWDGFQLRRYQADPENPGALPESYILSLKVDGAGRLWIGTNSGGVARYDAAHDNFVSLGVGKNGLSDGRVTSLAEDGHGGMWVGTNGGLERVDAAGVVHAAGSGAPQIAAAALPKGGVEALLRDRSGALWIGTRQGLWRRDADHAPLVPVRLAAGSAGEPTVSVLYQDSAGRIWIGTRANGAFVQHDAAHGPVAVSESHSPSMLENERVFSVVEKTANVIWLGTEGGGIVEIDVGQGHTRRIKHQAEIPDSLVNDEVVALLRDRSGQVFVATTDGLDQHDPRNEGVLTVRTLGDGQKLDVPSMLARPDGRVWLGVAGGLIKIVDPAVGIVGALGPATGKRPGGLPKGRIMSIAGGPDGTVFIGTQQGLFRSNADGGDIRHVDIPGRAATAPVWSVAWRNGVLWVGGLDGVWRLRMTPAGLPEALRHEDAALGDMRVTAILPLDDGSAWLGTQAGLARLDASKSEVEVVPVHPTDRTRMPGNYVASIMQDNRGRIWISTFSTGIVLLERTDAQGRRWFRRFGTTEGLPDNGVNALVQDKAGKIWISTDSGVAQIDPDTFAIRRLGVADGVQVSAYWSGSGALTPSGDVLFGGLSGLTVLQPGRLKPPGYRASMAITQVSLGGRAMAPVAADAKGSTPLHIAPEERERGMTLEFSALDYAPLEYRKYAYRLDGFDRGWIETTTSPPRASYTNLPPGTYTLELKGTAENGATALLRVPVVALPSWYQKDSVRVLAGVCVLGVLALLVQARTSWLRRRQRELEAIVAARTAELRETQVRLEEMAYGDMLTGLPNRRHFNDALRRMVAQAARGGTPFTLLLIDLDHFKSINDTLGHDAGDALLVCASARLRSAVREGDLVARLGGDEFAVLLAPGCDAVIVEEICQRIVAGMAVPIVHGTHTMQISASIGVAGYTKELDSAERLYKCADVALYKAKEAGRNTWSMAVAA